MNEQPNSAVVIETGSDYRVNLDVFEGPLDLLIHLIRKNDLDVYDIPIAFVLDEYMKYIDTLKELDIDLAGDFLLMAADLAHIKSRLLLPQEEVESPEEDDPRADLIRRLLEYQQFKEASQKLAERKMLGRDVFAARTKEAVETDAGGPVEGNVFDLVEAFSKMLKNVPAERYHDVTVDRISISDRIYQIISLVKKDATVQLTDLFTGAVTRYDILITFLALLEMCKLRMVRVYQSGLFSNILIQGRMEEISPDEVMELVEMEVTSVVEKPREAKE